MFKNYLYLNRLSVELNLILRGVKIAEAFTQERDKLYLNIGNSESPSRHLLISTDPNLPFITTINSFSKAKKNTFSFFQEYLPDTIEGVFIAENDRIILIKLLKSSLYIVFRGSLSNIFLLTADTTILPFKKNDEEKTKSLLADISGTSFISGFSEPDLTAIGSELDEKDLKVKLPFLSKQLMSVLKTKCEKTDCRNAVKTLINEFFYSDIAISKFSGEASFIPASWVSDGTDDEKKVFNNYIDALNFYLKEGYKTDRIQHLKILLEKNIKNDLEKTSAKLNNLKIRLEAGPKDKEYSLFANVLLMNREKLSKGMNSISLENYLNGEVLNIKLNPLKSPQKNIDNYFEKAKDEKQNYEISNELFVSNKKKYEKLKIAFEKLSMCSDIKELESLQKELKITDRTGKMETDNERKIKSKHYIIDGKYHLYVGKDSASNDQLTTKFAKQNDYWFHARSVSGSHTVLKNDNKKDVIPKSVLKTAAAIAAFHSKSKTSSIAPVVYTFAKYVVKKKGMPVGQVQLLKENVILVKPEIPANCEYVED